METAIRQRARELGWNLCRFTTADSPASTGRFQQWIESGCQGEMAYLARNAPKRMDPQLVLSGAKSVITLAAAYPDVQPEEFANPNRSGTSSPSDGGNPPSTTNDAPARPSDSALKQPTVAKGNAPFPHPASRNARFPGKIARYARFADYHDVLAEALKPLTVFIDHLTNAETHSLWYVDTGPILERDLAQRAGLGFIGKHTNLISRQLGNWFFLAEILTTLELAPDSSESNHCGHCTRCLAACPTQAITAPFQLDARRCISYLTIELKGSIPPELRAAIGDRIFGCDDCLEVCPWNRFAQQGQLMRPHTRPALAQPQLLELLELNHEAFRQRFSGTPVLRTKRRGLLRNVCVALGNVGDASVLPNLRRAATDPEPLIAEHANWAIRQIENKQG